MSLARQVIDLATESGVMVTTAESCTGGMIAVALTDLAGSSSVFERGFVTYSDAAKTELLGVAAETLRAHGAVSEAVAQEMAQGALSRSAAHLCVSVTGIAGPGSSASKPEGRVCFGVAGDDILRVETVEFGALGRDRVRQAARDHALTLLIEALS